MGVIMAAVSGVVSLYPPLPYPARRGLSSPPPAPPYALLLLLLLRPNRLIPSPKLLPFRAEK